MKKLTKCGRFVIWYHTENIDGKTYQANSRFEYYARPSENKSIRRMQK